MGLISKPLTELKQRLHEYVIGERAALQLSTAIRNQSLPDTFTALLSLADQARQVYQRGTVIASQTRIGPALDEIYFRIHRAGTYAYDTDLAQKGWALLHEDAQRLENAVRRGATMPQTDHIKEMLVWLGELLETLYQHVDHIKMEADLQEAQKAIHEVTLALPESTITAGDFVEARRPLSTRRDVFEGCPVEIESVILNGTTKPFWRVHNRGKPMWPYDLVPLGEGESEAAALASAREELRRRPRQPKE